MYIYTKHTIETHEHEHAHIHNTVETCTWGTSIILQQLGKLLMYATIVSSLL